MNAMILLAQGFYHTARTFSQGETMAIVFIPIGF